MPLVIFKIISNKITMTEQAKTYFKQYAEIGFYTEPTYTLSIIVKGETTNITYTYDRAGKQWKTGGTDSTTMDITTLLWDNYDKNLSANGKWYLKKGDTSVDKPTYVITVAGWLAEYITPWEPAPRTVYMDSNIALTDGKDSVGSGKAKTIPNLYEAIHDIKDAITEHDHDDEYLSKSDSKLVVIDKSATSTENIVAAINELNTNIGNLEDKDISNVEALMYADMDNGTYVLSPGDKGSIATGNRAHATEAKTDTTLRLKAQEIEFEVGSVGAAKKYNLGAIIEAIQELNRRTMYMDTNVDFATGAAYNDQETGIDGANYENKEDGLPAASNGHIIPVVEDDT